MNSAMEFARIVQTESLFEKVSFGIHSSLGGRPGIRPISCLSYDRFLLEASRSDIDCPIVSFFIGHSASDGAVRLRRRAAR
jgi:hypothetical protein